VVSNRPKLIPNKRVSKKVVNIFECDYLGRVEVPAFSYFITYLD